MSGVQLYMHVGYGLMGTTSVLCIFANPYLNPSIVEDLPMDAKRQESSEYVWWIMAVLVVRKSS